jgi:hypothetical protein
LLSSVTIRCKGADLTALLLLSLQQEDGVSFLLL